MLSDIISSQEFQRLAKEYDIPYFRHWTRGEDVWQGKEKTVLLSNYHDRAIGEEALRILDDPRTVRWYGNNAAIEHPKLTCIPFGIDERRMIDVPARDKDVLLYVNFRTRHKAREGLYGRFKFATEEPWDKNNKPGYFESLARARFVLAPPGGGMDTYRAYEALAFGAVPVLLRSTITNLFGNAALVVDAWDEVTQERLESFKPHENPALTKQYWRKEIEGRVQTCRSL